tara:strand:- start:170 stop:586 length:417 start_codon:yes stop_codon:yes gene_type:complete
MVWANYYINYWAILVAGIVGMIIGFAWYSPALFGKQWMKLTGIRPSKKDKEGMGTKMLVAFIAELVLAFVLLGIIKWAGVITIGGALAVGFITWLGFVATMTINEILWQKKPFQLYILNNTHNLFKFLVVAIILTLWT